MELNQPGEHTSQNNRIIRRQKPLEGAKTAIAQSPECHRKLGQAIAVGQDGKVVILAADQILLPKPEIQTEPSEP